MRVGVGVGESNSGGGGDGETGGKGGALRFADGRVRASRLRCKGTTGEGAPLCAGVCLLGLIWNVHSTSPASCTGIVRWIWTFPSLTVTSSPSMLSGIAVRFRRGVEGPVEVSAVVRVFVRYITNLEDSFYHRLYQPVHPLDESVGYCIQLTMPRSVVVAWQVVGGEKSGD